MHTYAMFAVAEHISELQAEAARARLHRHAGPSRLRTLADAVIAAFTGPSVPTAPLYALPTNK